MNYQLKIVLVDSEPEVWRQVLVSSKVVLQDLHGIIQRAMGWENQHEYAFRQQIGGAACEIQQSLADLLSSAADKRLYYLYDFENGWLHRIEAEPLIKETAAELPICIDGAAACPPESSGGVWGYDELLVRLEDTSDPDYIELIDQYGSFDPDAFDLSAANARLASLFS
ncbi:MAG: plasmid pRiA4b ORF-3 family protein [Phormidesmis sp.]